MKNFSHTNITSVAEAIPLLHLQARPVAGGTDLVPLLREGIWEPEQLLNIKTIEGLRGIREEADGLHIGAITTLAELDHSALVRERYQALAQAARSAASPQLRNMATLGGNLLQQVRCWYYRGDFHCWLKGGDHCQARDGENQYHAVIDQSPCVAVYPSDPPAALVALDAAVRIAGPSGERTVAVADFLQPPNDARRVMHTLQLNEIITEVVLPPARGRSLYVKAMDRAVWAYALCSIAIAGEVEGDRVTNPRVVLGAVANTPVRLSEVEALIAGQALSDDLVHQAGAVAITAMQPLTGNHYKAPLARNLVRQALRDLVAPRSPA